MSHAQQTHIIARLPSAVYKDLEKKLTSVVVTEKTTEIQAGYMLGIQQALRVIREGFTIEAS
jgi:hypothetical protein